MSANEQDKEISYLQELFRDSLSLYEPTLNRMNDMQDAYDGIQSPNSPTLSEVYMPLIRTAVEVSVPTLMEYAFPSGGQMFGLMPTQRVLPYQVVSTVQDYFNDLILDKIEIKRPVLLALKDAAKHNIGYVKVSYKTITPLEEVTNAVFLGGQQEGSEQDIVRGVEQTITSTDYVHWGRIIPTPDGATPDEVTCTFELDYIRDDILTAMYKSEENLEPDKKTYMGKPEEIIEATRKGNMDGFVFPDWFVCINLSDGYSGLGGDNKRAYNEMARRTGNSNAPINIPVLKCYFRNEHIWLANGDTIMRRDTGGLQTLASPIVKFTLVPDSNRWSPLSDANADLGLVDGSNAILNATMDLLTYTLHPTTVVNKSLIPGDDDVGMTPHQIIEATGDASKAINYVNPPQIPQGVLNILSELKSESANTLGQPQQLQGQGTAGLMRGGMHGFESFLQTSFSRQKLAGAVIESEGLKQLISLIIIYEQVRMRSKESYIVRDPDNASNFVEKTITPEELRHVFAVKFNLQDKFMRSPIERNMDLQVAPILLRDPKYDWTAVSEEFLFGGNRNRMRKVLASPEVQKAQSEQIQKQQEQEQQAQQGQGSNLTSQAEAGAKSQG